MKRVLRELVADNCDTLRNSEQDFKTIYQVMFRLQDNILAEKNDGYRIQKYTYRQVQEMIETAAAALYGKIGAAHEYVGLEMENCVEWIVAFWAILKSGNKPYLVNCRHPLSLSEGIVASLKIRFIIGKGSTKLSGELIDITELIADSEAKKNIDQAKFSESFENEIALSTSATSLNEVVCFYTGREFANQLLYTQSILKESERISKHYHGMLKQLAFLPFYHIFGLTAVYFWFTYFGRTLVFLKDYSADTILNTVRKHEVTHIFAVPMLWHTIEKQLLKQLKQRGEKQEKKFYQGLKLCTGLQNLFPNAGARISKKIMHQVTDQLFGQSVQFCISGGSYIMDSAMKLFNGIGYPLHNGFGMSEIGITSVELRKRPKDRNKNTIGHPFKGVEYQIGERGTLRVRAASTCKAVMINGEYKKVDDWFETEDVMECDDQGYYYIKGRLGDAVIGENGENINPDVIEQNFHIQDAVNFSVLGLKQEGQTQEKLSMVICISKYLPAIRVNALMEEVYAVNGQLPTTAQIQDFYITYNEIAPPTAIKVGRKYLLRALEQKKVALIPFRELKSSIQAENPSGLNPQIAARVREIIAEELGIGETEIGDDTHILAELGADSLQYFSMLQKMAKEFSITVTGSESQNYKYTVREITLYIERYI